MDEEQEDAISKQKYMKYSKKKQISRNILYEITPICALQKSHGQFKHLSMFSAKMIQI